MDADEGDSDELDEVIDPPTTPSKTHPQQSFPPQNQSSQEVQYDFQRPLSAAATPASNTPFHIKGSVTPQNSPFQGTPSPKVGIDGKGNSTLLSLGKPTPQPHLVYSAEILPSTFVVVVTRQHDRAKVIPQLEAMRISLKDWLQKQYSDFLLTKALTHLPVLRYLPSTPGLIHFVFFPPVCHSHSPIRFSWTEQKMFLFLPASHNFMGNHVLRPTAPNPSKHLYGKWLDMEGGGFHKDSLLQCQK